MAPFCNLFMERPSYFTPRQPPPSTVECKQVIKEVGLFLQCKRSPVSQCSVLSSVDSLCPPSK